MIFLIDEYTWWNDTDLDEDHDHRHSKNNQQSEDSGTMRCVIVFGELEEILSHMIGEAMDTLPSDPRNG